MKIVTFSAPVSAANYVAGGNTGVVGAALLSIDYVGGTYRFQLVNPDGSLDPNVNGVNVSMPDQDTAAADIRAAVAATIPA